MNLLFLLFITPLLAENNVSEKQTNFNREQAVDDVRKEKKAIISTESQDTEALGCNSAFIDSFIFRDNNSKHISIDLNTPFPECPLIQKSCCTVSELSRFVASFKIRVNTIKKMYHLIYETFKLFGSKRDEINDILQDMGPDDEKCAGVSKSEAFYVNEKIHYIGKYKKYLIEDYLKYIIEYHSGFVCTICNAKMHKYMKVDTYATFTMNGNQCTEIFQQYYSFLNLHLNILKLSQLNKALQCIILKSFKTFDPFLNVDFDESLEDIHECYTKDGSIVFENNEKCAFLCKSLGIFNIVSNLDNMFSITAKANSFYHSTLFKKNHLISSRSFNKENLSLMIFPYVKDPPVKIDEYNLVIDSEKGLYPHHHRMNIDFNKGTTIIKVIISVIAINLL